jgi:hypothetical protein
MELKASADPPLYRVVSSYMPLENFREGLVKC